MRCSLSLRQIEKYTAEEWPTREYPICKQVALAKKRVRARIATERIIESVVFGSVEQFEMALMDLRSVMDE